VQPDIVTTAKALGNGVPVGAFLLNEKLAASSLVPGDHGTTYGGNPFVCAAVAKVLEIFERDSIFEHVQQLTPYLEQQLDTLIARHSQPSPSDVQLIARRGMGFMQGIVVEGKSVAEISKKALENGLIIISAGINVLRLVPPLIITKEQIDEMIEKLEKSL